VLFNWPFDISANPPQGPAASDAGIGEQDVAFAELAGALRDALRAPRGDG